MEVLAIAIKEKEIEGIQVGNREVKLSLFAEDMILYRENPKDAARRLLYLSNELSNIAKYNIIHRNLWALSFLIT